MPLNLLLDYPFTGGTLMTTGALVWLLIGLGALYYGVRRVAATVAASRRRRAARQALPAVPPVSPETVAAEVQHQTHAALDHALGVSTAEAIPHQRRRRGER